MVSEVIEVIRSDMIEDKLVAQPHIVLGPQTCASDSDMLGAMPNSDQANACIGTNDIELVTAVQMPDLDQKMLTHVVKVSDICFWERSSAQMLPKHGERDDIDEQQRSTTFECSMIPGQKVEKFHAQLFEAQIE